MVGHQLREAAAEQRQEEHLAHAGEAVPDGLGIGEDRQLTAHQADDAGGEDADGQRQKHIHADDGQGQHQQIGQHLEKLKAPLLHDRSRLRPGHDQQDHQRHHRGGDGDEEVDPELVLELAALGLGGGDGGIGDHGQVVAEHGAAGAGAQHHRHTQTALRGQAHGDGHQRRDRSHRGAGGGAQKGGDHKDAGGQQLHRDQGQAQVHRGLHAAHGLGHRGKGAGQDVDHQHGQNVFIGCAPGKDGELLVNALPAHAEGRQHGDEHGRDRGELVKGHLRPLGLEIQSGAQINGDKNQKRQQGQTAAPLVQIVFHGRYPPLSLTHAIV